MERHRTAAASEYRGRDQMGTTLTEAPKSPEQSLIRPTMREKSAF